MAGSGTYGDVYGDLYGDNLLAAVVIPEDAYARPIVEIGFTTDPTMNGGAYAHWSDPLRLWDNALWAPDDIWTDVTPWLTSCNWQRGATRVEGPVLRYEPSTATVNLINIDGRFNPLNLAGPYVSGSKSQVRPMVPIRIRVQFGNETYDQFRGFVDSWSITYPSPQDGRATVTATDAQKVLSRLIRTAVPAVGDGERSGARINRILDSVFWPAADRDIDRGEVTVQSTTLDGNAWDEMLLVQDTEIGSLYVSPIGKVTFRSRYASLTSNKSTQTQGIFGSDRSNDELVYISVNPSYDDANISNVVRIARVNGTVQEARDNASIIEFLESTHERTDLIMQTDTDALYYAQYLLSKSKDPELLFTQLQVDPLADPNVLFPQVLQRDFGHRITIRSRPPGISMIERDVYVRGISATYGGTNQWSWSWVLQPADVGGYAVWDIGTWNKSAWAF